MTLSGCHLDLSNVKSSSWNTILQLLKDNYSIICDSSRKCVYLGSFKMYNWLVFVHRARTDLWLYAIYVFIHSVQFLSFASVICRLTLGLISANNKIWLQSKKTQRGKQPIKDGHFHWCVGKQVVKAGDYDKLLQRYITHQQHQPCANRWAGN